MRSQLQITCATVALVWACSASAQEAGAGSPEDQATLDEIVVTATKTGATNLQDTPIAITAFTAEMLDRTGIKDPRDLVQLTPGLAITQNSAFAQVYIRGIGSNNVFGGSDPSSTTYIDGVYLARSSTQLSNFLDVERVEVLRGPQGTLYGRNAVGGTINVISRRPGNDVEGKVQATYGNYDMLRGEGYISGPIVEDRLAASFSLMGSRRDAYLENVVPGVGDLDNERMWATRGQLRFTPGDRLELLVRADYSRADDALAGYTKLLQPSPTDPVVNTTLGDYSKVAVNIQPSQDRRQWGVSGEASYELTDTLTLTSLTAYRENRLIGSIDTDATSVNVRRTDQFEAQSQFSQEVNLSGDLERLRYVIGLYYFDEKIDVLSTVTTFGAVRATFQPTINTDAIAAYGQATYDLTDRLSLTAGVRYTDETKEIRQNAIQFALPAETVRPGFPRTYNIKDDYKAWTPKVGVEFRPSDDVMLYVSATRGFKSGGFNFASLNPAQGFDPETLWSYEAGAKLDLLDNKLRINTSAFHYDYKNLQVQSFITPGVIDITNASDAKVDGVEVEVQARPALGLLLGGNLAYLDARYENYPTALAPGNIPFDASGRRLSLAPKWAYFAFGQYDWDVGSGSAFTRIEYSHRTRQFFTALNRASESQEGYGLLNASIGYTFPGDKLRLIAFGRNLADKEYVTSTASFTGPISGKVGEPRLYGVRASYSF